MGLMWPSRGNSCQRSLRPSRVRPPKERLARPKGTGSARFSPCLSPKNPHQISNKNYALAGRIPSSIPADGCNQGAATYSHHRCGRQCDPE